MIGRGGDTIYACSHLYAVEVDFHYAVLGPEYLYQDREVGFEAFAHPTVSGPKEYVFGCLLCDGACSALALAGAFFLNGFAYSLEVKSVVGVEVAVLGGYDRLRHP